MLWALLAGAGASWAACGADPPGRPRADLDAALGRGEVAIANLDPDGLSSAVAEAHAVLPCLADGLAPTDVARWFRVTGLERFIANDPAAAAERFRAARGLEPAWQLDPGLGQPIRDAWEAAPPRDGGTRPLTHPGAGWLQVDGRRSTDAPVDEPFVVQWFDAAGAVGWTGEIPTGADLPADLVQRMGPPPPRRAANGDGHLSRILLGTGIGLAVVGAGGLAGAGATQSAFTRSDEPSTSQANQSLISANHALGWTGIVGAVAGVGVGVSAVVVGRW